MDDLLLERLVETNRITNKCMIKNNVNPLEYNWKVIFADLSEKYSLRSIGYPFEEISNLYHAGILTTDKVRKKWKIFYNTNMPKGRQNFTVCHEMSHYIYDAKFGDNLNYFSNSFLTPYSEEEKRMELLADASAGVMMLPDYVIVKYMETNKSFPKMAEELEMTEAALYTRLMQFFTSTIELSEPFAKRLIREFQNQGKKFHINASLSGWGSTKKNEIIYFYENT